MKFLATAVVLGIFSAPAFAGSIVCHDLYPTNKATYTVLMTPGPNPEALEVLADVMGREISYTLETDNYPSPVNMPDVITSFVGKNQTTGTRLVVNFSRDRIGSVVHIEDAGVWVFDAECQWLE